MTRDRSIFDFRRTSRPLPLRACGRDLVVRRQRWQGREYWTIKDPLTLQVLSLRGRGVRDPLACSTARRASEQIRERVRAAVRPAAALGGAASAPADACSIAATCWWPTRRARASSCSQRDRQRSSAGNGSARVGQLPGDPLSRRRSRSAADGWLNRRVGWLFSLPAAAACAAR